MESLRIPVGYGVELATLMDTAARHGLDALAQVDLGTRAHRHQANHDLALMAAELLLVAERRRPAAAAGPGAVLRQYVRAEDGGVAPRPGPVPTERPPAATVRSPARPRGERAAGRAAAGRPLVRAPPAAGHGDRQPDPGLLLQPGHHLGRERGYGPGAPGRRRGRGHHRHRRRPGRARLGGGRRRGDPPHGRLHRRGPRRLPGRGDQLGHLAARGRPGGLRRGRRPDQRQLGRPGPPAGRGGRRVRRRAGLRARRPAAAADPPAPGRLRRRDGRRAGADAGAGRPGGRGRASTRPGSSSTRPTTSARTPGTRWRSPGGWPR